MPANHGGARAGAGRKKGKVSQAVRDLRDMAKDHAKDALDVLVTIAMSPAAAESARVAAANAILDRGYGKPSQALDHTSSDGSMTPTRIELVALTADDNGEG